MASETEASAAASTEARPAISSPAEGAGQFGAIRRHAAEVRQEMIEQLVQKIAATRGTLEQLERELAFLNGPARPAGSVVAASRSEPPPNPVPVAETLLITDPGDTPFYRAQQVIRAELDAENRRVTLQGGTPASVVLAPVGAAEVARVAASLRLPEAAVPVDDLLEYLALRRGRHPVEIISPTALNVTEEVAESRQEDYARHLRVATYFPRD